MPDEELDRAGSVDRRASLSPHPPGGSVGHRQVGEQGRAISEVAGEIAVGWRAVQSALEVSGTPLIQDPARMAAVTMMGVDETGFLKAQPKAATRFVSAVVDLCRPRVLDLFEGRHAAQLDRWLSDQPQRWKGDIEVTVCDLHEPFRRALRQHFPDAITVADPFHVVGVATRALEEGVGDDGGLLLQTESERLGAAMVSSSGRASRSG
jgi:transposase